MYNKLDCQNQMDQGVVKIEIIQIVHVVAGHTLVSCIELTHLLLNLKHKRYPFHFHQIQGVKNHHPFVRVHLTHEHPFHSMHKHQTMHSLNPASMGLGCLPVLVWYQLILIQIPYLYQLFFIFLILAWYWYQAQYSFSAYICRYMCGIQSKLVPDLGHTRVIQYFVLMLISVLVQVFDTIYHTNIGVYRILGKLVYLPSS